MTVPALRVGVAGVGVVGSALIRYLKDRPTFAPSGRRVDVVAVCARDRAKDRGFDASSVTWFDDPVALAKSADIDLFVELMGGAGDPAKAAVEAAIDAGKTVVTANKALIAHHGLALARKAEAQGVGLHFEAAVMGGVPAVKLVREGLIGEDIAAIAGILNGTCNFILSEMERTEQDFQTVLAEAQRLGYAEADPTTDVGGFDAAHKAAILAALAFGGAPNLNDAEIEGIDAITLLDIKLARNLGYRIKLIAEAVGRKGAATVRVAPALVPLGHPVAETGGALNALFVEGALIGRLFLQGPGAGGPQTAAAVAADIADAIAHPARPVFSSPADRLQPLPRPPEDGASEKVYIRIMVRDEPGAIAAISEALARSKVSIDSFLQRPVEDTGHVPIVLITHPVSPKALGEAVEAIAALSLTVERPRTIRVAHL